MVPDFTQTFLSLFSNVDYETEDPGSLALKVEAEYGGEMEGYIFTM